MTTAPGLQMSITNYDDNKGLIPIQLGTARVITGYNKLLHIINLTIYDPTISNIKTNVNKILDAVTSNSNLQTLYTQRAAMLSEQAAQLVKTLKHIKPRTSDKHYNRRNKRGLIDGLGSVIKGITGNLDQTDYREISEAIANINLNEDIITHKINEQISINNQMIFRFNEIKEFLDNSTNEIKKQLGLYKNASQDILEIISFEQYLHHTSYTIDQLQTHLDNLLDIITHAKLQIISHHLLDKKELTFIEDQLKSQNIFINSEHNIYELLHLKAYYNQSVIIFSIEIPTFHRNSFKQYYLQPTTINNTYSLYIPNNILVLNDQVYQYISKPCDEIEDQYYCHQEQLQQTKTNCVAQIILNQPAHCNLIKSVLSEDITQIFGQYLYINTRKPLDFTTTCGLQNQRNIDGIKLISFANCSITINNTVYTNEAPIFYEQLLNLLPYHEINTRNIETPIDLPQLNNQTIFNMEKLQELHHSTALAHHQTIFCIISALLFLCIFGYLLFIRYFPNCTIRQNLNTSSIKNSTSKLDDHITRSVRSSLEGEELRPSQAYTITTLPTKNSDDLMHMPVTHITTCHKSHVAL